VKEFLTNFVTPRQALRVGAPAEIVWFGHRTRGAGADEGVCPTPAGGPQYCTAPKGMLPWMGEEARSLTWRIWDVFQIKFSHTQRRGPQGW
jgi:hypothetical protein